MDKPRAHQEGDALDVIKDNLALWQGEIALLEELLTLQAKSAAHTVSHGALDPDALRGEALRLWGQEHAHSPANRAAQLTQRLALCQELCQSEGESEPPKKADTTPAEPARVAILGGPAFGAAVAVFSAVIPTAEPVHCHSFADILEEVASGRAPFGILPIEDSAQGKLFRIYEQCESYELHIACTTDIKDEAGKTVRMALLYKNEAPNASMTRGERTLECLLYGDEKALVELLTVATALGFTLRRVDSLPLSYREDGFVQHVVLCGEEGNTAALMTYLGLFMPHTTVTADYINIKARDTQ